MTFYVSFTGKSPVVGLVFNHLVCFQRNLSFIDVPQASTISGQFLCLKTKFNAPFLGIDHS